MKKDITEFVLQPDFSDVTPEMIISFPRMEALYEKAFYSQEEVSNSEYCQNTTTWD